MAVQSSRSSERRCSEIRGNKVTSRGAIEISIFMRKWHYVQFSFILLTQKEGKEELQTYSMDCVGGGGRTGNSGSAVFYILIHVAQYFLYLIISCASPCHILFHSSFHSATQLTGGNRCCLPKELERELKRNVETVNQTKIYEKLLLLDNEHEEMSIQSLPAEIVKEVHIRGGRK